LGGVAVLRLKFEFEVTKEEISLDYRRVFISFFKKALEKNNSREKENYYHKADPIQKAFTFSVFFKNPQFRKDHILLGDKKVVLNFSTYSKKNGLIYFDAIMGMIDYKFPLQNDNHITLKNVSVVKEREIKTESVGVSILSPLLARVHNKEKNFDKYLSFKDEAFPEVVKNNLKYTLERFGDKQLLNSLEKFEVIDVGGTKAIKVLFYKHKVDGNIGRFVIKGEVRLIDFIIKAGLGSRTSSGFGMLEVEGVNT
jgi:CRISPR-associated endoribonuclease Cas6